MSDKSGGIRTWDRERRGFCICAMNEHGVSYITYKIRKRVNPNYKCRIVCSTFMQDPMRVGFYL